MEPRVTYQVNSVPNVALKPVKHPSQAFAKPRFNAPAKPWPKDVDIKVVKWPKL